MILSKSDRLPPVALAVERGGKNVRYFSDRQISEMRDRVYQEIDPKSRAAYMMYVDRIDQANQRYDNGTGSREELLQAMAELERFSGQRVPHDKKIL